MCAIFFVFCWKYKKYRKELVFSYNFIKFALNIIQVKHKILST